VPFDRRLGRAARIARRAVGLRCPRCGQTPLFRGWFRMASDCALCGLRFERAQGYFVGAIYINYAVSSVIAVGGYFALWGWADLSTAWQFAIWVPFLLVFPLWFFRYSRSFWLALEYLVNPD
jgi:uncharacterized protein (DUF983 family)